MNGLGPWAAIEKTTGSWVGKLGMNPEVPVVWYAIDRVAWHTLKKEETV